jgi:hypothetical protein
MSQPSETSTTGDVPPEDHRTPDVVPLVLSSDGQSTDPALSGNAPDRWVEWDARISLIDELLSKAFKVTGNPHGPPMARKTVKRTGRFGGLIRVPATLSVDPATEDGVLVRYMNRRMDGSSVPNSFTI